MRRRRVVNKIPANVSRKRILEEAIGIVGGEERNGITMRGLAQRVGHSAAAIYLHFEGKEELEREIALHGLQLLERAVAPAFAAEDASEAVAELVRRYVQFGLSHARLYRLMFQNLTPLRTPVSESDPPLARLRAATVALCERGVASGAFAPLDPALAIAVRWSMVHGFVQLATLQRLPGTEAGGVDLERLCDALVETLLRSLRA
jgi:AcrR family transcriptional regulator